jgi:hypothetical protein
LESDGLRGDFRNGSRKSEVSGRPLRLASPGAGVPWYNRNMETITRNVRDMGESERSAVERLVGHDLRENQQLIIQVVSVEMGAPQPADDRKGDELPGATSTRG